MLRRRVGRREGPIHLGELVIDPVTRSVRVDDRDVQPRKLRDVT